MQEIRGIERQMSIVGGIVVGACLTIVTWPLAGAMTANLPQGRAQPVFIFLLVVAAVCGFLAGAVIYRRATLRREHLQLFSGLAGGTAGGVIGCAYALTLTAVYLGAYATWPKDLLNQVLTVLAYPIFGAFGLSGGALVGVVFGLVVGGLARLTAAVR